MKKKFTIMAKGDDVKMKVSVSIAARPGVFFRHTFKKFSESQAENIIEAVSQRFGAVNIKIKGIGVH